MKERDSEIDRIRLEHAAMKHVFREVLWMAARYADGRSTYAPGMVNQAIDVAKRAGIEIEPDATRGCRVYCTDGSFGEWDAQLGRFVQGAPKL